MKTIYANDSMTDEQIAFNAIRREFNTDRDNESEKYMFTLDELVAISDAAAGCLIPTKPKHGWIEFTNDKGLSVMGYHNNRGLVLDIVDMADWLWQKCFDLNINFAAGYEYLSYIAFVAGAIDKIALVIADTDKTGD